jgi:hypothetical protein
MSSLSDIILLIKQAAVLRIAHRAIITSLGASKYSSGLLQALTYYLLYPHLKKIQNTIKHNITSQPYYGIVTCSMFSI